MNSDLVLEVPDTPDRIKMPIYLSSGSSARSDTVKSRNASFQGRSSRGNVGGVSPALTDADRLFAQARLARLLPRDLEDKSSLPNLDGAQELSREGVVFDVVPDTPDRIKPISFVSSARRDTIKIDASPSSSYGISKNRDACSHGQSSRGNIGSVSLAPTDADHLFRQAQMARTLSSEDCEAKSSSPNPDKTRKLSRVSDGSRRSVETTDLNQSGGFSHLHQATRRDSSGMSRRRPFSQVEGTQQDMNHRTAEFRGVGTSLPTVSVGRPRSKNGIRVSDGSKEVMHDEAYPALGDRGDKGKATDHHSTEAPSIPLQPVVPRRQVGQSRLVHNGCISPCNVARSVKVDSKQVTCSTTGVLHHSNPQALLEKGDLFDLSNNLPAIADQGRVTSEGFISANNGERRAANKLRVAKVGKMAFPEAVSHAMISRPSCPEGRPGYSNKGKEIISDNVAANRQDGRICPRIIEDCTIIATTDSDSVRSGDQGWRTTHNYKNKLPRSSLCETSSNCMGELVSACPSDQNQETAIGDSNNSIVLGRSNQTVVPQPSNPSSESRKIRLRIGKRKLGSTYYHPGGSSSSAHDPEISYLGSLNTTSNRTRNSRRRGIVLGPVVEIDDISSPEVRLGDSQHHTDGTSDDPSARAKQLESDELLARQLQEQLYNDTPRVASTEEIDAIIAMSLQQEETVQRTSRVARWNHRNTRGASNAHLYAQTSHQNSQPAARAQHRTAILDLPLDLRATGNFDTAEIPTHLHVHREFNADDYEMLLALDRDNHQHTGASRSQINNLPQSVVQSVSIEDCAVCLEKPSIGDTIRILPCLHKFHKSCIDEWLRRKKSCPICKSGIT